MKLFAIRFVLENPGVILPEFWEELREGVEVYKLGKLSRQEFYEQLYPFTKKGLGEG
jgi:hypothetical protein